MLTAEGVAAIVDFQHHPFGNAYFPTKECGGTVGSYDSDVRHCWAKACIGVASPPTDCFSATVPVSQHGEKEYAVNKYQACAQAVTLSVRNQALYQGDGHADSDRSSERDL